MGSRGLALILIVLAVAAGAAFYFLRKPARTPPTAGPSGPARIAEARLERGRYLVENLMLCFACHSETEWKTAPGLPVAGKKGAGTIFVDETLPFKLMAPNITPDRETGIGTWSDEEIGRGIREGIGRDGRRLFPAMPYLLFRSLSDEDLAAVTAYVRSIPPVRHETPRTEIPKPFQAMIPPPIPLAKPAPPPASDPVRRGEYLAALGICIECHTPLSPKGEPMMNLAYAGGRLLKGPWGEVSSANITPDASGIPHYDEKMFIQTMRTGQVAGTGRKLNPVMLTGYFRKLTDDDLKAIFAYVRTLKPIPHRVDNTEKPTACKLCGGAHGFGDKN